MHLAEAVVILATELHAQVPQPYPVSGCLGPLDKAVAFVSAAVRRDLLTGHLIEDGAKDLRCFEYHLAKTDVVQSLSAIAR